LAEASDELRFAVFLDFLAAKAKSASPLRLESEAEQKRRDCQLIDGLSRLRRSAFAGSVAEVNS
jgi:hypothetical protein